MVSLEGGAPRVAQPEATHEAARQNARAERNGSGIGKPVCNRGVSLRSSPAGAPVPAGRRSRRGWRGGGGSGGAGASGVESGSAGPARSDLARNGRWPVRRGLRLARCCRGSCDRAGWRRESTPARGWRGAWLALGNGGGAPKPARAAPGARALKWREARQRRRSTRALKWRGAR